MFAAVTHCPNSQLSQNYCQEVCFFCFCFFFFSYGAQASQVTSPTGCQGPKEGFLCAAFIPMNIRIKQKY